MYYHKENMLEFSLSPGLDTKYFIPVSSINSDYHKTLKQLLSPFHHERQTNLCIK